MSKTPPQLPMYEKYGSTEFGGYGQNIGRQGYQGITKMLPTINTMDEATMAGLEGNVNNIYNRAVSDFGKDYADTMGKTLARDYGRFGTTGATPSLYNRDMYNLQQQRKLADLQYDKAKTRDQFINSELGRRYSALNAYGNAFNTGNEVGLSDWETGKTNVDRQYQNDFNRWKTRQSIASVFLGPVGQDLFTPNADATYGNMYSGMGGKSDAMSKIAMMVASIATGVPTGLPSSTSTTSTPWSSSFNTNFGQSNNPISSINNLDKYGYLTRESSGRDWGRYDYLSEGV